METTEEITPICIGILGEEIESCPCPGCMAGEAEVRPYHAMIPEPTGFLTIIPGEQHPTWTGKT